MAMNENGLSKVIVDAAIEVHRTLGGPGLIEDVYEEALAYELQSRGFQVERHHKFNITYKGVELESLLRIDLMVNDLVVVECKATEKHHPVFEAQTLTYLRQTGKRLGLLINFGETRVASGIRRVVNGLPDR